MDRMAEGVAILRELGDFPAWKLASAIRAEGWPGLLEVVPSYETIGITFDPAIFPWEVFSAAPHPEVTDFVSTTHRVPVCYAHGLDLNAVAELRGMSQEEVIDAHSGESYQCATVGFCPGFAYLESLPESISGVPRLPSPRLRVEPGYVGITGRQTAVYPLPRPGGWHLIGRTPLVMVDVGEKFYPIAPGDSVRFVPISSTAFERLSAYRLDDVSVWKAIDLNVDLAEGFPHDEELLQSVSSVNICCGAHAGSPELSKQVARKARELGVRIGAHPGYPDRDSMGRANWLTPARKSEATASLRSQIRLLVDEGAAYIKPHGAFYNDAASGGLAGEILEQLLREFGLPLMGLPKTAHEEIARAAGVEFVREGFAERGYDDLGFLLPRGLPGAILEDRQQIANQSVALAEMVDTICVHGDRPDAVAVLALVRSTLEFEAYEVHA